MQVLVLLSLGATSIGGAITLGSLFHYFNMRSERAQSCGRAAREELVQRERDLAALSERVSAELDAKRAELEALTLRACRAADALGEALESTSLALGRSASDQNSSRVGADFKFTEFDEPGRRASA